MASLVGVCAATSTRAEEDSRIEVVDASPAAALCLGRPSPLPNATNEEQRLLTARAGRVDDAHDPWIRCVEVPSTEVPLARWLADGWALRADGARASPPLPARARLRLSELARGAPQHSERLSVLEDARLDAPDLWLAYSIAGADARDTAALGLTAVLLAAPRRGRLPRLVVRGRRRAREASASIECLRDVSAVLVHLPILAHSSIDRVDRYVVSTLRELRINGPSPNEMEWARRLYRTELVAKQQRPVDRARSLAETAQCGLPSPDRLAALVGSLAPGDVRRAAGTYLKPTRRSVVEIYPPGFPKDDASLSGFRLHTVADGEAWAGVARLYGVSAESIARVNELSTRHRLSPGQVLWVPPSSAAGHAGDRSEATATEPSADPGRTE